ncbi:MAG: acriflavine resistance protein B [Planctomycetaceae bacterium]|nr:MAG: acriflavine resistance protein B [Planctomycetaceae bacterium]
MSLVRSFVLNPVKVAVGVLLVALFGVIGLFQMPLQLTPEVQIPSITVETRWPGASPQEVEQEIILEQEEQLKSVEGITKLSSESMDSMGRITLEFAIGTNMNEALLKVNSRLQQVPQYPENADQPVISTSNSANAPIAWFILSPRLPDHERIAEFQRQHPDLQAALEPIRTCHNPGLAMLRLRKLADQHPEVRELLPPEELDVTKLRRFAEDYIEAAFERVPGVANSNVIGGLEDELQVIVDPEQLAARQLTITDVRNVLRNQNRDTAGGDFWEGKRRWVVRTLGQFRTPEQVENQLLAIRDGKPVYIRDVAEVRLGYKKPDGLVRRFGDSSIAINCLRENNANVLEVMAALREVNRQLNAGVLAQRGLQLVQVYDETEYIYSAIGLVRENIFLGAALTMTVLMFFLHLNRRTLLLAPLILLSGLASVYIASWFFAICLALIIIAGFWYARGALVIGLAIPTSIVGTFLILSLLGRTLNVISLAGLAFAVGMLVDNAVVILENIYSRFQRGDDPMTAAVEGTQEVWGAVVSSTLTTVAVFLPVIFVQEEAGQLFRDIALAISAAVSLSLIASVVVIPPAAYRIIPARRDAHVDQVPKGLASGVQRLAEWFSGLVTQLNRGIQYNTLTRLATLALFLSLCYLLAVVLAPQVEYLPTGNRNLVFGILLPPPGYNLDELTTMGQFAENELRPYWDIDAEEIERQRQSITWWDWLRYRVTGKKTPALEVVTRPAIADFFFVARGRQVFIGVRSLDPTRAAELIPLVRQLGTKLPGTIAVAFQSSLFSQGLVAGRTIDIEITGPELSELIRLGARILAGDPPGTAQRLPSVMELIPGAQARPVPSLDLSSPEIHVHPKLWQAAEMELTASELGYTVDALVDGAYASDYFMGADKIDLTIRGRDEYAAKTQDISSLPIAVRTGQLIPLAAVADVQLASGPEQINHRERERAITIAVTPPPEISLEEAIRRIQSQIITPLEQQGVLTGGYRINLAGTADKLQQTWVALRFNFLLALLITYLLLAALYESWIYPLVIIFSVPLGAVGGLVGLKLLTFYLIFLGQPPQALDVLTMLGFVILIGTVVNNAILVVDQALQLIRQEGYNARNAIVEGVRTRIRPMFMTTLTTVLGLLPLVLFPGAGSELYRGLGSVVLSGLLVSTLFTLFLVPAAFTLTWDVEHWFLRLIGRGERPVLVGQASSALASGSQQLNEVSPLSHRDKRPQPSSSR